MKEVKPIVVYHAAGMGNWRQVVPEQMAVLRHCGLTQIRMTHVGEGLPEMMKAASKNGIEVDVVRSDSNVSHYETLAMIEIERLAKVVKVDRPILYFHTKGVSAPHDVSKVHWRRVMQRYVLVGWRECVQHLASHDAVGVNWLYGKHFSGTFWIANADWIRKLPDFAHYHGQNGLTRYTCENWIGSAPDIRTKSVGIEGVEWWRGGDGWNRWEMLEKYPS